MSSESREPFERYEEDGYACVIEQSSKKVRVSIFHSDTFDILRMHEIELPILSPEDGWYEQDANLIIIKVQECLHEVMKKLDDQRDHEKCIISVGITNERDSFVVWDSNTGEALTNVILWMDNRATVSVEKLLKKLPDDKRSIDCVKYLCGLPLSALFCAVKLHWLRHHVKAVREAMDKGIARFGTIDTWLIYKLTGGLEYQGSHKTDVTNASRTMLMNLRTQLWDMELLNFFEVPYTMMPEICACSDIYGVIMFGTLRGVRISGCIANHQAALIALRCIRSGQATATYASGCTLLYNTGIRSIISENGLITTICYKMGFEHSVYYALEGEVTMAGNALVWLKDNLKIMESISEAESLANHVPNSGGVMFVPAFDGLGAPEWNPTARGVICGLNEATKSEHIVYAALESICFQVCSILNAMASDTDIPVHNLKVTGALITNKLLLQMQADLGNINVMVTTTRMTNALGAAIVALHFLNSSFDLFHPGFVQVQKGFAPQLSKKERKRRHNLWQMALVRAKNWDISPMMLNNVTEPPNL